MFIRGLTAAVMAASFSVVLASGVLAAPDAGTGTTSTNWAGHAVQASSGSSFNFVTASWVEPAMAVACGSPGSSPSLATFSVGFDGYGNGTHEHVGTAMQCAGPPGATPMFKETAYYETCVGFTCKTVRLGPAFPLHAGDHILAAAYYADGNFTFVLHNTRTGQTFNATVAAAGDRTSAEAIVDDPVGPGVAPLLNFGKVTFLGFYAHETGDDHGDGEHANRSWHSTMVAITMMDPAGNVRAETTKGEGNHFTVTWKHS